jgi:hypothetical protein
MAKRKKYIPLEEFVVISDDGYFAGLYNGGYFRWSFDIKQAKPLTNIEQFETLKKGVFGRELILDFIK